MVLCDLRLSSTKATPTYIVVGMAAMLAANCSVPILWDFNCRDSPEPEEFFEKKARAPILRFYLCLGPSPKEMPLPSAVFRIASANVAWESWLRRTLPAHVSFHVVCRMRVQHRMFDMTHVSTPPTPVLISLQSERGCWVSSTGLCNSQQL